MATDTEVVQEVRTRFAAIMSLEPNGLDMEAKLDDTYGVESMNALRLISELEVALDADIPEEELTDVNTLNDVVGLCTKYAKAD